jgi:hypothetical protein
MDTRSPAPSRYHRWYVPTILVAVLAASLPPLVAGASSGGDGASRRTLPTASRAVTARAPAGNVVKAKTYAKAPKPSAADLARMRVYQERSPRPGPSAKVYNGPYPAPVGKGATPPAKRSSAPLATTFRNKLIPDNGSMSGVNEPSTDGEGKYVFATGNWYAAYSKNKGGAWTYLNPYTIFGSGFCCDQLTIYDAGRNRQFWLAQFGDHLVIANSSGTDLANWCYWNVTPSWFGYDNATTAFDYNHIGLSTNFLYVSTDVYSSTSTDWSVVFRLPIAPMTTCSGFSYSWLGTQDFAPAFVQGAGDTMYWGTNWASDVSLGSQFKVRYWADNSGAISTFVRNIDAFPFMFGNQGLCGSANGTVKNWCQRTDSRMAGGGYLAIPTAATAGFGSNNAILGFAFNAKQDGGHPQPFIRRIYFRLSDLAYIGYSEFWCTVCAVLYPDMAPDRRGHIGMVWAWGGGTESLVYYPGGGYLIEDDLAPFQPWDYNFLIYGSGNPCLNIADNMYRWGDYLTVRPYHPADVGWLGTVFSLRSDAGSCTSPAAVNVYNLVFGQARDLAAYKRWAGK